MSCALRIARELALLAVVSCAAAALIAALVALAVGSIAPEIWPTAFLQAFPIFAALVFAGLLLIELVSGPDFGGGQ